MANPQEVISSYLKTDTADTAFACFFGLLQHARAIVLCYEWQR